MDGFLSRIALRVMRLIKLQDQISWCLEESHQTKSVIFNRCGELHALFGELARRYLQVVGIKRDVVRIVGIAVFARGMHSEVALGQVKNKPAFAHVGAGKAQLLSKEITKLSRNIRIEHGVDAFDHAFIVSPFVAELNR